MKTKNKHNKKIKKPARSLGFYLKNHKPLVTFYFVTLVISQVLKIISVFLAAFFLAEIVVSNYSLAITYLIWGLVGLILHEAMFAIYVKIFYDLLAIVSKEIKIDLVTRAFNISSKTFSEKASGVFINRINGDPERALWAIDVIAGNLTQILSVIATLFYVVISSFWVGLILVISLVFLFIYEAIRNKLWEKNEKIQKKASDKATSLTSEIIRSERDIKSLDLEGKLKVLAEENYGDKAKVDKKLYVQNMYFWSTRSMFVHILLVGALLVGIFLVQELALSMATFLFVYSNRGTFEGVVWQYGQMAQEYTSMKVATGRMFEVFDEDKFPIEHFGNVSAKLSGKIEFKNVSFSYLDDIIKEDDGEIISKNEDDEKNKKSYKQIFNSLSFCIPANKTVAFAGKSGSGKTTVLSLISKLYDVDGGQILLDGIDVKELSKESLREGISLVNQFPYVFNTSIKENLLMANKCATYEEIVTASKQASLHDFILTLKNGYETKVGEGGIKLSGGQKQRLAIARALLRKSKIILFDESTSSLDNTTQNEISESINNLSGGHTVVIVAHRLSTIKNADIIFFLEDGKVSAQGTFNQLVKNHKGFKEFFEAELGA